MASGERPKSAELKLHKGKQVLGKTFLTTDCQRSGAVEQMGWDGLGISIGGSLEEQVGHIKRADPVLRQWNKCDSFSTIPLQCWVG